MKHLISILILATFVNLAIGQIKEIDPVNYSAFGFRENKGQIIDQNDQPNREVLYLYAGTNLNVQLKQNSFSYEIVQNDASTRLLKSRIDSNPELVYWQTEYHRVDVLFIGANPSPQILASHKHREYENYYTTGSSDSGITFVHLYNRVLYKELYPGIDLEFISDESGQVKFNFIISPGKNPDIIRWKYEGANQVHLIESKLQIETSLHPITESIPQSFDHKTQASLPVHYKAYTNGIWGFETNGLENKNGLTIDPLPWVTYFGGNDVDIGYCLRTDKSGHFYTSGLTGSTNVIATSGAHQTSKSSSGDAFLEKFDLDGNRIWGTYYGGSKSDIFNSIEPIENGLIYAGGYSNSSNNIASSNAYQPTLGGNGNADWLLVLFTSDGIRKWGTYYGTLGSDVVEALAVDRHANVFAAGRVAYSGSTTNLSSNGAFQTSFAGGTWDILLAKFDSTGNRVWCTYYGTSGTEGTQSLCIDQNANIYGLGHAGNAGLATTGAYQSTVIGGSDMFIFSFDSSGNRRWATYFGDSLTEYPQCIHLSDSSSLLVSGQSDSPNGIASSGTKLNSTYAGGGDAVLIKFSTSGNFQWAGYFGGSGMECANGVSSDSNGDIYIVGQTNSPNGIASTNAYLDSFYSYDNHGFVAKFKSDGTPIWSTYIGALEDEVLYSCDIDTANYLIFSGQVQSQTGIVTNNATQKTHGGSIFDVLLGRFNPDGYPNEIEDNYISVDTSICFSVGDSIIGSQAKIYNTPADYRWIFSTKDSVSGFTAIPDDTLSPHYFFQSSLPNCWIRRVAYIGNQNDTSNAIVVHPEIYPLFNLPSDTLCSNDLVHLKDSSMNYKSSTYELLWEFGDGFSDTAKIVSHLYGIDSVFQVKMKLETNNGCRYSALHLLNILAAPDIKVIAPVDTFCTRTLLKFLDTSTLRNDSIIYRLWDFGDGIQDSLKSTSHTYNSSGVYRVNFETQASNGCRSVWTDSISVYEKPVALFNVLNSRFCSGQEILIQDSSLSGMDSIVNRIWNFGNGHTDTTYYTQVTYADSGLYNLQLQILTNNGCRDTSFLKLNVHPTPAAFFNSLPDTICSNEPLELLDASNWKGDHRKSSSWYFNQSLYDTAINTEYLERNFGQVIFKLITESSHGCIDSMLRQTFIKEAPISKINLENNPICAGQAFYASDSSSVDSMNRVFRNWKFEKALDTSSAISFTLYDSGNYPIHLVIGAENGCYDTSTRFLKVNPKPTFGPIVGDSNNLLLNQAYPYSISMNHNDSLRWLLWNGVFISGENDSNCVVKWIDRTCEIRAILQNSFGCSDSVSMKITTINVPKIISFNPKQGTRGDTIFIAGDEFLNVNEVTFGGTPAKSFIVQSQYEIYAILDTGTTGDVVVSSLAGSDTAIGFTYLIQNRLNTPGFENVYPYPNPTRDYLNISFTKITSIPYELFDITGALVYSGILTSTQSQIDLRSLPEGNYILCLKSANPSIFRIVKVN